MTDKIKLEEQSAKGLSKRLGVTQSNLTLINDIIKKLIEEDGKEITNIPQDLIAIYNQLETAPDILYTVYCYTRALDRKKLQFKIGKIIENLLA